MTAADIPVVDLAELASPKKDIANHAAEALLHAFGRFGLVYLRNHGIEPSDLDEFYSSFLDLTSRPEAEKSRLGGGDIWFQRGWTPPNTEQAVLAAGQPDFKECYFAAPEPLDPVASLQYPEIYATNVWPDNGLELRERYMAIGHQIHEVGLALLRGAARALDLEPYRFEAAVYGASHVTRALRYLPVTAEQIADNVLWGEEHTDFNLLTLLPGGRFLDPSGERCQKPDPAAGLYLRTRPDAEHPRGEMVQGSAPAGCIVAQVGQQLEILTGGTFLATPHVIKAPKTPGYSRVSMAHFIHLHAHQVLFPYERFRTPDTVAAYSPPVLVGTYATKTLVDIGLAPAEALEQLGYRYYNRLESIRAAESS